MNIKLNKVNCQSQFVSQDNWSNSHIKPSNVIIRFVQDISRCNTGVSLTQIYGDSLENHLWPVVLGS